MKRIIQILMLAAIGFLGFESVSTNSKVKDIADINAKITEMYELKKAEPDFYRIEKTELDSAVINLDKTFRLIENRLKMAQDTTQKQRVSEAEISKLYFAYTEVLSKKQILENIIQIAK